MERTLEEQYDDRDRNEHEPGEAGATSPGVEKSPRGNPETEQDDVRRGEEKLDRIVNW